MDFNNMFLMHKKQTQIEKTQDGRVDKHGACFLP